MRSRRPIANGPSCTTQVSTLAVNSGVQDADFYLMKGFHHVCIASVLQIATVQPLPRCRRKRKRSSRRWAKPSPCSPIPRRRFATTTGTTWTMTAALMAEVCAVSLKWVYTSLLVTCETVENMCALTEVEQEIDGCKLYELFFIELLSFLRSVVVNRLLVNEHDAEPFIIHAYFVHCSFIQ